MRPANRVFLTCATVVALTTAGLPFVSGYGTSLFQLIVLGAWVIIARLSSDSFAEHHASPVWAVAFLLNMLCFGIVGVPLWIAARKRLPKAGKLLIICWTVFYVALLFILFPATNGP